MRSRLFRISTRMFSDKTPRYSGNIDFKVVHDMGGHKLDAAAVEEVETYGNARKAYILNQFKLSKEDEAPGLLMPDGSTYQPKRDGHIAAVYHTPKDDTF